MTLEALIFGGMGSLAECAELDRAAWNAAFRMHDVPNDFNHLGQTFHREVLALDRHQDLGRARERCFR